MKQIRYAIDLDSGMVVSMVGREYAWPILDFAHMTPENAFETIYNLEKLDGAAGVGARLSFTKKIPLKFKNLHRAFWGMRPVRACASYCPDCGEYFKKCQCGKEGGPPQ